MTTLPMQLSYDNEPAAGVAGMKADTGHSEVVTAANLGRIAYTIDVDTVANATLYRVTVSYLSRAGATYGQTLTANCDYTSDGSATELEILNNLVTQINASSAPISAQKLSDTGPLQVYGNSADQNFTLSVNSANLSTPSLETGEIPFGVFVCKDATSGKCRVPYSEADVTTNLKGLAVRNMAQENHSDGSTNAYPLGSAVSIAENGMFFVSPEQDVTEDDQVFVRFSPNGANTQRGAVRKDRDGTAQVTDVTPTAANTTPYVLSIGAYSYPYLSDGSGTVAEIVAALVALVNAQSSLNGVTAADATTKLTLTAAVAGVPFDVSASANLAVAAVTANALHAAPIDAYFKDTVAAAGIARANLDL